MHLSSVIPANDAREFVFAHRNFPRREQGSNLGPIVQEASAKPLSYHALTTTNICYQDEKYNYFSGP